MSEIVMTAEPELFLPNNCIFLVTLRRKLHHSFLSFALLMRIGCMDLECHHLSAPCRKLLLIFFALLLQLIEVLL